MRILIILLVAVATMVLVAGCKVIATSRGPDQVGLYLNDRLDTPIKRIAEPETKMVDYEWNGTTGQYPVPDWDATFAANEEKIVHPDKNGVFFLNVYPSSIAEKFMGEWNINVLPLEYQTGDPVPPGKTVNFVYINDLKRGSGDNLKLIAKFQVTLSQHGRYYVDEPESTGGSAGIILVEWK